MYQFTGQGQDLLQQARQLHTESNDWRARRHYEKSIDLLEQALKLRRTALISPHPVLTATIDALAHMYQITGNFERWRHYANLAVNEKVGMLGELHVETQDALSNLCDACVAMGDHEAAAEVRSRNWHARTSTLGIEDTTVSTEGLVGDMERMLHYIKRDLAPKIRGMGEMSGGSGSLSGGDGGDETRLKVTNTAVDTVAAVERAQAATKALMQCDFNDRKPLKRDPELEQLLMKGMTEADYVQQFGRAPDPRWRAKGAATDGTGQLNINQATGLPSTPSDSRSGTVDPSVAGGGGPPSERSRSEADGVSGAPSRPAESAESESAAGEAEAEGEAPPAEEEDDSAAPPAES